MALDGEARQVHSERERQLIAPSLRWTNGDSDLTLLMHYQRDDMNAGFYNQVPRAAVFGNPNGNGRIPLNFRAGDPTWDLWNVKTWSVGYLFNHDFNDALSFRQNLRYIKQNMNARRTWSWPKKDPRILNREGVQDRIDSYIWTIDNQLQWKLTTGTINHTLLTGIDYFKGSSNGYIAYGPAPSLDLFAPVYNQIFPPPTTVFRDAKQDMQRTGIYMQDQIKVGDLSLLIGGRYDKTKSSWVNKARPGTDSRESDQAFTGRAGAIYNFASGFAPYVSYAESFDPSIGNAFDGSPFEPTEGKQYEAGIKYQPTGAEHLITMAAFDLIQENVITADPVNPGFRIQTGEVQVRGIELEGKFSVNDNLYVTGAYTYLDDEVTKSNNGDEGKRRSQIPRHNASLWANYSLNRGTMAGMGLGVGVRYIGKTEGDRLNTFSVPGYTLVDLAAHYDLGQSPFRLEGWRASLNVNNLFDKYYIASCDDEISCYLGLERSVRFSIGYEWDW